MAWLIVDAITADSIRKTAICPGQSFDPIPLKDGTFYLGDHPDIKAKDRSKAVLARTKQEYETLIVPKQKTKADLDTKIEEEQKAVEAIRAIEDK